MTTLLPPPPVVDLEAPERPEVRRSLGARLPEDRASLVGAGVASFALTYLVYFVLLPLSGVLGFLFVEFVVFVLIYGLMVSQTYPGVHVKDRIATVVIHGLASVLLVALLDIIYFTFKRGWDALHHANFFTQDLSEAGPLQPLTEGGVKHAMIGTFIMITIGLVITIPLGLIAAVYLSETTTRFSRFVRTIVEAMTALPSIIAGLFIYALIQTAQAKWGFGQKSGLAAALALSVMMLPIVIRAAMVVLRLVPGSLKEAAFALGAPRWRVAWHVVMPTARSGLMTAIILGTARGIGETSPVLLCAGYTLSVNHDPMNGAMVSLPLVTFILTRSAELNQIARGFGAASVLMLLVLLLFILARTIGGRGAGELSKRQQRRAIERSKKDVERFASYAAPEGQV